MTGKENLTRRGFIKGTTQTAVGAVLATKAATVGRNVLGANDRINIAVVGIRGRGRAHISSFAAIPNVRIAMLCDIDEKSAQSVTALRLGREYSERLFNNRDGVATHG